MGRVVWRSKAKSDLGAIFDYIATDSPTRAGAFLTRLVEFAELLSDNPLLGPARISTLPQLRIYPFRDYIFIYKPMADGVEVVRLIHGARDYHAIAHDMQDDDE
ncbi:MAG: type II toxin-antitoxin system RelE/ParE family toxin [Parvularculaceae bacterium]